MRRLSPLFFLLFALACPSAARADAASALFDPDRVAAIDISLPEESRTALNGDPDTYRPATLTFTVGSDTYGPLKVELRLKGSASFRGLDRKAAFKVKVKGQKLLGLKKLTLNNMIQDRSMLHETLGYEVFRAVGVPAPRTGYAFVRVNGEAYGVYLNAETLDDVALSQRFASTGHLYEAGYATDVRPGDLAKFEVDEGDAADTSDLEALVGAADGSRRFSDAMAGVADLDEMTRMWATEKYIGQWDGYAGRTGREQPNNYYLHSTTGGLFSMVPWGLDQAWVRRIGLEEGGLLYRRCTLDFACAWRFRRGLADVSRAVEGLDLPARVRSRSAMLEPYQRADPRKEASPEQIKSAVSDTLRFLAARRGDVDGWLGVEPADPVTPIASDLGPAAPETPALTTGVPARTLTGASAATPRLVVGATRRRGTRLSTRVRVPRAGVLRQRVTMTTGRRTVGVCAADPRRVGAGAAVARCTLSPAALRVLRRHALALDVRTTVTGLEPVRGVARLARCPGC